jgi:hypothetical protein
MTIRSGTRTLRASVPLLLSGFILLACTEPAPRVPGTMRFVLGGTSGTAGAAVAAASVGHAPLQTAALVAGVEYLVSPKRARITFTQVIFRDASGNPLGESDFTDCTVTYDRTLPSGSSLLDCDFTAPVGDIHQMAVYFDKDIEVLVSDATVGIYSDASVASKFTTVAPAGGATFVPYTITIGDQASRATPIIFTEPLTIAEGDTPELFVTTDMIHTFQMTVNSGGTTLTAHPGNDPVALFGGLTPGRSMYYSGATTIEGIVVQGAPYLRMFTDATGKPLFVISTTCGVDGPKGAWASPPIGATIGGWLGRDATGTIAWALPTTSSYSVYSAYFVMAERATLGQTTVLNCKTSASPPAPTDGKTYASGAPAMSGPTTSRTLTLIAK